MATRKAKLTPVPATTTPLVTIKKGAKPSKAASTDMAQPVLCNGFLRKNGDGWELVTTNSYIMARLPVTVDGINGTEPKQGPIPIAALKHAEGRNGGGLLLSDEHVEPANREGCGSEVLYKRREYEKVPDFDKILEDPKREAPFRVGLNAKLLHDLANALGTESVYLTFDAENNIKPIRVDHPNGDGDGVLMPIRIY